MNVAAAERLLDARIKAAEAATRQQELEAAVGATVQEVMTRLEEARERLRRLHAEWEAAGKRQSSLETQLALAQQQIKVLEEKLAEHARHRDAAVESLKRFAATKLLAVAGVEVDGEDPAGWSTTRAVEVARAVEAALSRLDSGPEAWERSQRGIHRYFVQLQETLLPQGYQPAGTITDDLFVVTVPFQGRELTMTQLRDALGDEVGHRQTLLDAREREVIENHLIGEVAIHLHELIHGAERWVREINEELTTRPMSTGMALRFLWEPLPDGPPGLAEARKRLLGTSGTWSPRDREALGEFLQRQIQSARAESEAGTWQDFLFAALDYRKWHRFVVLRKQDGQWKRLTRRTHGTGSGGEKVIALVIPQFAAAAAHYRSASPLAPRLILLDEAFVGVDSDMRSKCMDLLRVFDLDFVMTSEREWGCYPTLPGLAIYQLATREGIDAVGVTRWVWNGRQRTLDRQAMRDRLAGPADAHPTPLLGRRRTSEGVRRRWTWRGCGKRWERRRWTGWSGACGTAWSGASRWKGRSAFVGRRPRSATPWTACWDASRRGRRSSPSISGSLRKSCRGPRSAMTWPRRSSRSRGPVTNQAEQNARRQRQWNDLYRDVESRLAHGPSWSAGWPRSAPRGCSCGSAGRIPRRAGRLLRQAADVVLRLPLEGTALAELAAEATGDSHALDAGQPLGTLVLRAAALLAGVERTGDAQARRDAWAGVGVLCDELSGPVLVLNLPGDADSLTGRALRLHAEHGEPYRLSVRQLLRHPPRFDGVLAGRTVFICENVTVLAAAANRLGAQCAAGLHRRAAEDRRSAALHSARQRRGAAGLSRRLRLAGHRHGEPDSSPAPGGARGACRSSRISRPPTAPV